MNPLHWKREYQIAFLGAAVLGSYIGTFVGVRQAEPSATFYWLWVGLWGVAGTLMSAAGAFIRQLLRDQIYNWDTVNAGPSTYPVKGHAVMSVKVRPKPKDSGFEAREAPWRESKTAQPSDNMLERSVREASGCNVQ
jgi:hypothetical protein